MTYPREEPESDHSEIGRSSLRIAKLIPAAKVKPGYKPLTEQDSANTTDKQDKRQGKFKRLLGWCALGILIFLGLAAAGQNIQPRVGQQ